MFFQPACHIHVTHQSTEVPPLFQSPLHFIFSLFHHSPVQHYAWYEPFWSYWCLLPEPLIFFKKLCYYPSFIFFILLVNKYVCFIKILVSSLHFGFKPHLTNWLTLILIKVSALNFRDVVDMLILPPVFLSPAGATVQLDPCISCRLPKRNLSATACSRVEQSRSHLSSRRGRLPQLKKYFQSEASLRLSGVRAQNGFSYGWDFEFVLVSFGFSSHVQHLNTLWRLVLLIKVKILTSLP